jgi:hypothetical protein
MAQYSGYTRLAGGRRRTGEATGHLLAEVAVDAVSTITTPTPRKMARGPCGPWRTCTTSAFSKKASFRSGDEAGSCEGSSSCSERQSASVGVEN